MSNYGFIITSEGRKLLAGLLAGEKLILSKVIIGSGKLADNINPADLTDLINPIANAVITKPINKDGVISFIVEYRSDMNDGLKKGFWIQEFGIFAKKPDESEVLLYYATLGDYPQYISEYKNGVIDTRRFPISITVSTDTNVEINIPIGAYVIPDDMENYFKVSAMPEIVNKINEIIEIHNSNDNTHEQLSSQLKNWSVNQFSNPNLLINGDFQIWQRGTSFERYPSNSLNTHVYTADRWTFWAVATTKINKIDNGLKFYTNNSQTVLIQTVENYRFLAGKTVTLSAKIAHVTGNLALIIENGVAESGKYDINQPGIYSVVMKNAENIRFLKCYIRSGDGNPVDAEIEYMKLELGEKVTPFTPRSYSEELADCQRYYEKIDFQSIPPVSYDADYFIRYEQFKVKKRIPPKVKIYSCATNREGYIPSWNWARNQDMKCKIDVINDTGFRICSDGEYIQDTRHFDFYWIADAEIYD